MKIAPKAQREGLSEDAHPFQPVLPLFCGMLASRPKPHLQSWGGGVSHRGKGRDTISSQGTDSADTEEGHWRVLEAAACHRHDVTNHRSAHHTAMKHLLSKPEFNANLFVSR